MRRVQQNWLGSAIGLRMDPDKAYNLQCVDVVDHYAEAIFPGVKWPVSVGGVNGAKDLLVTMNRNFWQIIPNKQGNDTWLPAPGDVVVWGGTSVQPYGHTGVVSHRGANKHGVWVVQQNSNGLANQAAHEAFLPYYSIGTGHILGWARPRADKMPADPVAAPKTALRKVTARVAMVRTSPRVESGNIARQYPTGIAAGANLAVVGYVKGQDPYPNDKITDDAWYKTVSGLYVWANAAGNNISGLAKLN